MATIPAPRGSNTALAGLLDSHRALLQHGFEPQAQILAQGLLDRVMVTSTGGGVLDPITSRESLVLLERVIDATAPDLRDTVRNIMIGL